MRWVQLTLMTAAGAGMLLLGGCGRTLSASPGAQSPPPKMAAILPGAIQDQSWNKTNYEGILKCREDLGVDLEYMEDVAESDFEAVLTDYARQSYGLVIAAGSQFDEAVAAGKIRLIDPRDDYLDSIMAQIDMPAIRARRPRVVVDPMYGVSLAGILTIFYTARCDINVINDRHDAFFGGHLPAPNPETLRDLQAAVLDHHALLGIATDGDADRLGIVDEKGTYVSANEVLVLLYYYLLKYKGWRGDVVRNLSTTHLLDRVAADFGQVCHEVPVGFKYISAAMDEYDAIIGGESSGGLTVRGHIRGKDGLYAASLLVEMLCATRKTLSELGEEIYERYGEMHMAEYDWALTEKNRAEIDRLLMQEKRLPAFTRPVQRVNYMDGCKVYFEDGWVSARFSGTEPRIRIFAESGTMESAVELVRVMARFTGLSEPD